MWTIPVGSRGRGMQQNVAAAMGYTAAPRRAPESIPCHRCKTPCGQQNFDTDEIGRLVQTCPGCGHRERVSPDGDAMDAERAKRLLEEVKALARSPRAPIAKKYPDRICERTECAATFEPKSGNQRFCSQLCSAKVQAKAMSGGRGKTLGAAGRTNPKS